MSDDRLPILLVVLDGLGDRPCEELGSLTPSEAAATPHLDALAQAGQSGIHQPFGPGCATSSETAHWSMYGFERIPFPGRAALEGLGAGLDLPAGVPLFHLALRGGEMRRDAIYLRGRAQRGRDEADAAALFNSLGGRSCRGVRFDLQPLRTGECLLLAHGARSRDVSDSDALFDQLHPWMRPVALETAAEPPAACQCAAALEQWLQDSQQILLQHPTNRRRRERGLTPLDVPVTKWGSWLDTGLPSFEQHVGLKGAVVTDTALYRGLARLLGMRITDIAYDGSNPAADMEKRLHAATALLQEHDFVHVHVKATDAAGHRKQPTYKRDVIAATDAGLRDLLTIGDTAVVAVTGDHATPSVGPLLHSGDPTPFVVAGPGVGADRVARFGETPALQGSCGRLRAAEILPLLLGLANRPFFRGHRPGARDTLALPNRPEPMPVTASVERAS
ncbi:MAG: alkaline phosphatase family protein [Gammaproteobacteria bacterium]|nr:alkaline phosphatase family protein [Gammaproteobacteria bacterium]